MTSPSPLDLQHLPFISLKVTRLWSSEPEREFICAWERKSSKSSNFKLFKDCLASLSKTKCNFDWNFCFNSSLKSHYFNKRRKRNFGNKVYSLPHLHESNNCQWLSYFSRSLRSLLNCGIVYHISNSIFTLPLSGHQIQRVYKCEPHFFASMILLSLILTTGWLKIRKSRHLLCVDICIPFIYIHISHSSHPY